MPSRRADADLNRRRPDRNVAAVRRAALVEAGHTIQNLADAADVSWRFAKYWVEDEKTSSIVEAAWRKLTGRAA